MHVRSIRLIPAVSFFVAGSLSLSASQLTVQSYDMLNGEAHTYSYMDKTYNGSGNPTVALSPLSGGTGLLTDGTVGVTNFAANLGNGAAYEWVGWALNPQFPPTPIDTTDSFATITFKLTSPALVNTVSLFINNSARVEGGVAIFGTATISFSNDDVNFVDPVTYITSSADQADATARYINIATNQTTPFQYVQIHLTHDPNFQNSWVFLSEVNFDGTTNGNAATPEPASALLAGLGLC
jgi:predicted outer membrane repeat protein